MGIKPEDCAAFVIVPDKDAKHESGSEISLSKNVFQDLESFIENFNGDEQFPEDCVYIFRDFEGHSDFNDVERTTPRAFYCTEDSEMDLLDKNNYDSYGCIFVEVVDEEEEDSERDDVPLLYCINGHIENPASSWVKIPRHHQPEPQFSVPPVPTLEQRMLKQSALPVDDSEHKLKVNHTVDRRMLLLLRRK